MNEPSIEELRELYLQRRFTEIIDAAYPFFKKRGIRKGKSCANDWHICKLLCSSLYLTGYYADCLETMKMLFSGVTFRSMVPDTHERAHLIECALESLLYCVFNKLPVEFDANTELTSLLAKAAAHFDESETYKDTKYQQVKALYEKYLAGEEPYYTISFFVSLELKLEQYAFDLTDAPPYRSMEIKKETRGQVEGMSVSVSITGFIKADAWWEGPIWEMRRKGTAAILPLNLLNRMLLIIAEGDTHDFMPRVKPEQLSSMVLCQYMGDGEIYHWCDGTDFSAQFARKWAQGSEYSEETLKEINSLLVSNYRNPLYATLYHQAQNVMLAGLYEESIMMYFACVEATVYHWCERISELRGVRAEYDAFREEKPNCQGCSMFASNPSAKGVKNHLTSPPIPQYIKFLYEQKIINRDQERALTKRIRHAQGDGLRNKMMHGEIESVSLLQVESCRRHVYELNKQFMKIADGISGSPISHS